MKSSETKVALLFGGGLDSLALLNYYDNREIWPLLLYIDWGAKAQQGELAALGRAAKRYQCDYRVLEIPKRTRFHSPLTDQPQVTQHAKNFVPFRNLLFASLALAAVAGSGVEHIAFGFHKEPEGSVYYDAMIEFIEGLNRVLEFAYPSEQVRFVAPFYHLDRFEYLLAACRGGHPHLFEESFSCYESRSLVECGECTHCAQKAALKLRVHEQLLLGK